MSNVAGTVAAAAIDRFATLIAVGCIGIAGADRKPCREISPGVVGDGLFAAFRGIP